MATGFLHDVLFHLGRGSCRKQPITSNIPMLGESEIIRCLLLVGAFRKVEYVLCGPFARSLTTCALTTLLRCSVDNPELEEETTAN